MCKLVLLTAVLLALAACATQDSPPTATPDTRASGVNRDYVGAATASIEERIWLSDVVVRANLQSSGAGLLTFRAVEYLKGTGPSTFTVSAETAGRPTTWDGQEAVLFLNASSKRSTTAFEFTDTTTRRFGPDRPEDPYAGTLPEGYTVDSRNPVWVPLSSGNVRAYRAYDVGSGESIDLDDLRATITWLGGSGDDYDTCIRGALWLIRSQRDWEVYHGSPNRVDHDATISSGDAAAVVSQSEPGETDGYTTYSNRWVEGQDSELFSEVNIDDDTDPTNGFTEALMVARPLPAGTYEFRSRWQRPHQVPCNYISESSGPFWTVTVTALAGTVHEAFFDPVAIGTAVGADAANGVLDEAGFTAGGTATSISSLKWESGVVTMQLSPAASLSGYDIDVIELDGSTSLTLSVAGATSNAGGTLTWAVGNQPWHAGDQLMLRLRTAGDGHGDAGSHVHADTDAGAHCYAGGHSYAGAYRYARTDGHAGAYRYAGADGHARADGYARP